MEEASEASKSSRNGGSDGRRSIHPYTVALIVLLMVIIVFYTYFFFARDLPFREAGSDSYSHLGILRCTREQMGLEEDLSSNMFPYLYRENNRTGINYVLMALVSALPGISNTTTLYIFGILGIVVFFSGLYFMVWRLFASRRVAFLAALFALVLCGYGPRMHGNSYTSVEILANAHYASILSLGIALFLVGLNVRFLEEGSWKQYILQAFLCAAAFNIHMLTGMEYFLILVILVVVYAIREKRLSGRHLLLLSLIPAALALATLWPLYHWYSIFGKNPLGFGGNGTLHASVGEFLDRIVLYLIGLPFLISAKKERMFLLAWAVIFAIICLSFLAPITVAYYWRFAYVMRIPLVIGLALGLGKDVWALRRWKLAAVTVMLAIMAAFIGVSIWSSVLRYQAIMGKNAYAKVADFASYAEEGNNLIAHPTPGYNLMGVSGYNVVSVTEGHAPAEFTQDRNLELRVAFVAPTSEEWRELLTGYEADQVLVPRSPQYCDLQLLLNGIRLARNPYFDLYETDPGDIDSATYTQAPDPDLERSAIENGFTRYDLWADVMVAGKEGALLQAVNDPGEAGDSYLRVESEGRMDTLLFLNRGFIEVDPNRPYVLQSSLRSASGSPRAYLLLYQYDEPGIEGALYKTDLQVELAGEDWRTVEYAIGPQPGDRRGFDFNPGTRYVKIGLLIECDDSDALEVDSIRIDAKGSR